VRFLTPSLPCPCSAMRYSGSRDRMYADTNLPDQSCPLLSVSACLQVLILHGDSTLADCRRCCHTPMACEKKFWDPSQSFAMLSNRSS
jgi:hypothetical protein